MSKDRKWLREVREEKELTQEHLAEKLGITRQHIGMLENGISSPSPKLAKKIASILGFEWTKFFDDDDEPKATIK